MRRCTRRDGAAVAHLVVDERLARLHDLALVDAPVRVEQERLDAARDADRELGHGVGFVELEHAVLPVRQGEDLIERLFGHDVADLVGGDVALVEQALTERFGFLLFLGQQGVGHEHLGELLLCEQPRPEQAGAELLVGHRQRDRLHAALDQIDEAELVEVADLDDARGLSLREELQDAREVEPAYGTSQQHGSRNLPSPAGFRQSMAEMLGWSDVVGGPRGPGRALTLACEAGYTCPFDISERTRTP